MFPKDYMRPCERDYLPRTEDVTIYHHYEKFLNEDEEQFCQFCDKELAYLADEYEECDCEDSKDSQTGFPKLSQINLQSILDMLPEGAKPSDVKISINLDTGDMGVYGHEVTFSYSKTFEADPEGFKIAQEKYEEKYQAYLIEKEKYDKWKRQEEVKRLEAKLARLKK